MVGTITIKVQVEIKNGLAKIYYKKLVERKVIDIHLG